MNNKICKECGELIDDEGIEEYCSGCVGEAERYLDAIQSECQTTTVEKSRVKIPGQDF